MPKQTHPRPAKNSRPPRRHWLLWSTGIAIAAIILVAVIRKQTPPPMTPPSAPSSGIATFTKEGELTIVTTGDEHIVTIDIEIAESENERMLGLMYRQELGALQGMLFLFPYEEVQSFWMKNTPVPLDMLFINSRREIVTIHRNTAPNSEQSYSSTSPAQFVLEVKAGFVERNRISVGDRVQWRRM